MNQTQYKIIVELYINYHEAFETLSQEIRSEFFRILYEKFAA